MYNIYLYRQVPESSEGSGAHSPEYLCKVRKVRDQSGTSGTGKSEEHTPNPQKNDSKSIQNGPWAPMGAQSAGPRWCEWHRAAPRASFLRLLDPTWTPQEVPWGPLWLHSVRFWEPGPPKNEPKWGPRATEPT